jgi:hypothetical protein
VRLAALSGAQLALLPALWPVFAAERHLLLPGRAPGQLALLLHEEATGPDCILAYVHADLWSRHHEARHHAAGEDPPGGAAQQQQHAEQVAAAMGRSLRRAKRSLPALLAALQRSGWDAGRAVLEPTRLRASW